MCATKRVKIKKLESVIPTPVRPCDYISKRGVEYWWAPEWVRNLNGTITRIKPFKNKNEDVDLYMISKDGNPTFIQGSIQKEFKQWHIDRQIDYILLGFDMDDVMTPEWEVAKY